MKTIYLVIFQSKCGIHEVVSVHSTIDTANKRLEVVALEYAKQNNLEKHLMFVPGLKYLIAYLVTPNLPKDVYWWHILEMELDQ